MRLWVAQLISQFGDRITQMALIGLVYEMGGQKTSAVELAKVLSFTIIPVFIISPIAGVFVDRWDRRKTLFVCDIVRGLLVLTIPLIFMYWKTMIPIYIVVFIMFCFSRFYVPAKMSIIPEIVDKEHLLMANSMITITGMIAFAFGCALGGFLVEWFGSRGGFLIDAVTFFASASLIVSMTKHLYVKINGKKIIEKGKEILEIERSFWHEMKEGVVYLFHKKEIRFVVNMFFMLLAAAGAVYVVSIVFIQQTFNSITRHLGALAATMGVGLVFGALGYGRFGKNISWHKTIFSCLAGGGIMMILFVLGISRWPNVWIAFFLALGLGFVVGPIFVVSNTIVHHVADENMQGKVFSSLEIVIHLGFLLSMLLSSWLSEFISPGIILTCVGIIFSVLGMIGFLCYRKDPVL